MKSKLEEYYVFSAKMGILEANLYYIPHFIRYV
jgi:hypothetical protein